MISNKPNLADILKERILVLDGAMGTMIQEHELDESDFRGEIFPNHKSDLKGKVYGFERKSNFFYTHLMLGDTFIVARSLNDTPLSVGTEINLSFNYDKAFFFKKTFEL